MTDRHIEIHGYHDGELCWGFTVPLPEVTCNHPLPEQLIIDGVARCCVCGAERDTSAAGGVSP